MLKSLFFSQKLFFDIYVQLLSYYIVCILDEIGLAEDSEKMPLKALHPLLEDGTVGDEEYHPWKKVSCILIFLSRCYFETTFLKCISF